MAILFIVFYLFFWNNQNVVVNFLSNIITVIYYLEILLSGNNRYFLAIIELQWMGTFLIKYLLDFLMMKLFLLVFYTSMLRFSFILFLAKFQ